jgi:hypothetical protein
VGVRVGSEHLPANLVAAPERRREQHRSIRANRGSAKVQWGPLTQRGISAGQLHFRAVPVGGIEHPCPTTRMTPGSCGSPSPRLMTSASTGERTITCSAITSVTPDIQYRFRLIFIANSRLQGRPEKSTAGAKRVPYCERAQRPPWGRDGSGDEVHGSLHVHLHAHPGMYAALEHVSTLCKSPLDPYARVEAL